jgi:hypothetical protein
LERARVLTLSIRAADGAVRSAATHCLRHLGIP